MQWTSDKRLSSPPEFFSATAPPGDQTHWLRKMWSFFGQTVLPLNSSVDWDYIYVELAAEVGRVVVFPASSRTPNRVEKAGCYVVYPGLQSKYEELQALDEDAFEEGLTHEMEALSQDIFATAGVLRAACDDLPEGLPIKVWEPAEDGPTAEDVI